MTDILDELRDLHKQATEERSHYYTGMVIRRAIAEIEKYRTLQAMIRIAAEKLG